MFVGFSIGSLVCGAVLYLGKLPEGYGKKDNSDWFQDPTEKGWTPHFYPIAFKWMMLSGCAFLLFSAWCIFRVKEVS